VPATSRIHERLEVCLEARLRIASDSSEQLRFSGAAPSAVDDATIHVTVIDVGKGGIGMQAPVYLPRMALAYIEILEPRNTVAAAEDPAESAVLFVHLVRVRRCQMTSHLPTYLVGTAFESPDGDLTDQVDRFMHRLTEILPGVAHHRLQTLDEEASGA